MKQLFVLLMLSSITFLNAQNSFEEKKAVLRSEINTEMESLGESINGYNTTSKKKQLSLEELNDITDLYYERLGRITTSSNAIADLEREEELEKNPIVEDVIIPTKLKAKKRRTPMKFRLLSLVRNTRLIQSYGVNYLLANKEDIIGQKVWSSSDLEYGLGFSKSLGKSKNTRLFYGITINKRRVVLETNIDITYSTETPGYNVIYSIPTNPVSSSIGAHYVNIPIGVRFSNKKKLHAYIGGHIGVRYKGFVEKKYTSYSGEEKITAIHVADFGMNRFNYGVDISVGYRFIYLFAKYDFSPFFLDGPKHHMFSFGIRTY